MSCSRCGGVEVIIVAIITVVDGIAVVCAFIHLM